MPPRRARARKSKKGRLSGAMRESLNADRSDMAVQNALKAYESRTSVDTMFARVTGHLGMGHVRANIPNAEGKPIEIKAQIPNVLGRKGTTPINSQTVVAVFVGHGYDTTKFEKDTHFKITAVLRDSQAAQLVEAGVIPTWMTLKDASTTSGEVEEGYVFDYGGVKEEDDSEESSDEESSAVPSNTVDSGPLAESSDESGSEKKAAAKPAEKAGKGKAGKTNHRSGLSLPKEDDVFDFFG